MQNISVQLFTEKKNQISKLQSFYCIKKQRHPPYSISKHEHLTVATFGMKKGGQKRFRACLRTYNFSSSPLHYTIRASSKAPSRNASKVFESGIITKGPSC